MRMNDNYGFLYVVKMIYGSDVVSQSFLFLVFFSFMGLSLGYNCGSIAFGCAGHIVSASICLYFLNCTESL